MWVRILGAAVTVGSTLRLGPSVGRPNGDRDDRLLGVHVFFRHGARTPIYDIPYNREVVPEVLWDRSLTTDVEHTFAPYKVCDLDGQPHSVDLSAIPSNQRLMAGGALSGQLTRRGQEMMFELGQRLRRRYVEEYGLVSSIFDPQQVYCRSTRLSRNLRSMRCVLAGLFDWTAGTEDAVKIHVSHPKTEHLWPNRRLCTWVQDRIYNLKPIDFPQGMFALREKIASILGPDTLLAHRTLPDGTREAIPGWLYSVRDELYSRNFHGLPLTDTARELLDEMNAVCGYEMEAALTGVGENRRTVGLRAASGPLCQQILDNISDMTSTQPRGPKLLLFATHDAMMVPLLLVFNLFDGEWPDYGAWLEIEVHETKEGRRYVKLNYNGEVTVSFCGRILAAR